MRNFWWSHLVPAKCTLIYLTLQRFMILDFLIAKWKCFPLFMGLLSCPVTSDVPLELYCHFPQSILFPLEPNCALTCICHYCPCWPFVQKGMCFNGFVSPRHPTICLTFCFGHLLVARKNHILDTRISFSVLLLRHAQGTPPWILKWAGLESSGRRLNS